MGYWTELKTDEWAIKRAIILDRDKVCTKCSVDSRLRIHHLRYIEGRKAWEYEDNDLITVCDKCHLEIHNLPPNKLYSIDGYIKDMYYTNYKRDYNTLQTLKNHPYNQCIMELHNICEYDTGKLVFTEQEYKQLLVKFKLTDLQFLKIVDVLRKAKLLKTEHKIYYVNPLLYNRGSRINHNKLLK